MIRMVVTLSCLAWVAAPGRAEAEDFSYWMNMAKEAQVGDERIEYYGKALEAWTDGDGAAAKAEAYKQRGWAHYQKHDWAKVVDDETRSIALVDGDWETYHFRGWAHYSRGAFGPCAADHAKTVELHATDPYLGFGVAICRMLEGSPRKSIEASMKAIEIDPKFAMTYANLGFAYFDLKDYEAALLNFNKAIELDPEGKDQSPVVGLALVQWKMKKKADAKASLTAAIAKQADLDGIGVWMEMVRKYTPQQKAALKELKKAAKLK